MGRVAGGLKRRVTRPRRTGLERAYRRAKFVQSQVKDLAATLPEMEEETLEEFVFEDEEESKPEKYNPGLIPKMFLRGAIALPLGIVADIVLRFFICTFIPIPVLVDFLTSQEMSHIWISFFLFHLVGWLGAWNMVSAPEQEDKNVVVQKRDWTMEVEIDGQLYTARLNRG